MTNANMITISIMNSLNRFNDTHYTLPRKCGLYKLIVIGQKMSIKLVLFFFEIILFIFLIKIMKHKYSVIMSTLHK